MGESGRGCQGRDKDELEKNEGRGEEKKGPFWEFLGCTSGPIIGWSWNLLLSFLIYQMRRTCKRPPRSGVQEGPLTLARRGFPRSVSVCFFSQR